METLIPPAASDTKRAWSPSLRLFQCVGDAKHKLTPGSCWRQHNPPLRYQQLHHALMSPQNSVFIRTFSNGEIYCLPGAISPLIPSLHPVRRFLSSSVVSELLLRSGSHCDSCKGASFSKPVVLFLSCFCWLLGVLGVLFTPSLWVLQREQ